MAEETDRPDVTIRGTGEGLVISLGEGPFDKLLSELEARLTSRASFFLGGRASLQVGQRPLSAEQVRTIGAMVERFGMSLWAIIGEHPETHNAALELGLETGIRIARPAQPEHVGREDMTGIVARRTLRSGQALHYAGHITLIGDVNPGGELVAGGDVIVWGKLRGRVHAGAPGDDEAIVCALQLAPSQIRIGSFIARAPERGRLPEEPEIAWVEDGSILVERWTGSQQT